MRTSRVRRGLDDGLQVGDDVVAKDSIEIVDRASERIRGESIDVAIVGQSCELARLVLGIEEGCGSLRPEIVGVEAQGDVQEAVDSHDVGIPLVDGILDVALRGGGLGVKDAGEVLACEEGGGCCG